MSNQVLKLDEVVYSYKSKTGNNANIIRQAVGTFEKGKVYAILGGAGSGKTTMLSLIAGLDKVDSGRILLHGEDINNFDSDEYRSKLIGCSFSDFGLIEKYTPVENIMLQFEIAGNVKEENQKQKALDLLKKVQLEESKFDTKVLKLKKYDKQKIRLARAMATQSDLIIIDDINKDMDDEKSNEFLEFITSLAREDKLCIIFTTTSENFAAYADDVIKINRGSVIQKKE